MTTEHETAEFIERMEKDPKTFMTTSCCPAWVNLVGKHLPDLVDHVSLTPSPMVYAREIVKAKDPDAKTVFIGPCVAKRSEARRKDVDYVLSFEELGAILAGRKIDVIACEPWPVERPANPTARNYDGEAVRRRQDAGELPRGDGLSGRLPERPLFACLKGTGNADGRLI